MAYDVNLFRVDAVFTVCLIHQPSARDAGRAGESEGSGKGENEGEKGRK
jgi:hypothetical protein